MDEVNPLAALVVPRQHLCRRPRHAAVSDDDVRYLVIGELSIRAQAHLIREGGVVGNDQGHTMRSGEFDLMV